jgi:hypothetical protein
VIAPPPPPHTDNGHDLYSDSLSAYEQAKKSLIDEHILVDEIM